MLASHSDQPLKSIPEWNNKKIEHESWASPENIHRLEYARQVFRPANRKIVTEILARHVSLEGDIIEVGAGTGELVKLVPEIDDRLISTEQSAASLAENPATRKLRADAYELPFGNETAAAIVGYASYDVLLDLPLAIEEAARVLKGDGVLLQFLDIEACASTMFLNEQRRGNVVLPTLARDESGNIPVRIASLENVMAIYNELVPRVKTFLGAYIGNPEGLFRALHNPDNANLLNDFAGTLDTYDLGNVTTSNRYFKEHLEKAVRDFTDMEIILSDYVTESELVEKASINATPPEKWDAGHVGGFDLARSNYFTNQTGHMRASSNPGLSSFGGVYIGAVSTMYVLVAKKKKE